MGTKESFLGVGGSARQGSTIIKGNGVVWGAMGCAGGLEDPWHCSPDRSANGVYKRLYEPPAKNSTHLTYLAPKISHNVRRAGSNHVIWGSGPVGTMWIASTTN
jgi:hypothetical protein